MWSLRFLHLAFLIRINSDDLSTALKQASGVYSDASRRGAYDFGAINLNRTVIITGANYGYINHLENLRCFTERLGLQLLVLAMDQKTHKYVSTRIKSFISYPWISGGVIREEATEFRSKQFHLITNGKKSGVLAAMKLGYNVIFIDTDVALLRDPLPYLFYRNVDYVHSLNQICPNSKNWDFHRTEEEGNTGFYFVRSNTRTIQLFTDVMSSAASFPKLDDQTIFWQYIRKTKSPVIFPLTKCKNWQPDSLSSTPYDANTLVTCHLDGCLFSVGALRGNAWNWLRDNLAKRKDKACAVHANYLKGNKAKATELEAHGLWLASLKPDGSYSRKCHNFTPPL